MSERRARSAVLALSGLVLLLAVPYSLYLGERLRFLEEANYLRLATNVARGFHYSIDGIRSTAIWPPGYPLVLALPVWLGAGIPLLRLLNFGALALSVWLMYAMIRNIASPAAGLVAAALVVGYPVLFYAAGTFFQTPLGCALFVWVLYRLSRREGLSVGPLAITGLIFGYLILTVPSFVFQLVVVALWIAWWRPGMRLRSVAAVVLPALLVVSLWSVRNYAVFNRFVYVSNNGGVNLFIGNSQHASPNASPNVPGMDEHRAVIAAAGMNEVDGDRYLRRKAWDFVVNHKTQALKLYLLKNLNYFNFRNELHAVSEMSSTRDALMLLTYGPLLVVFLLRLALITKVPVARFEGLLLLLYFTNIPFAAVFVTRIRYRLPFDFLMIAVVAMFVARRIRTPAHPPVRLVGTPAQELRACTGDAGPPPIAS